MADELLTSRRSPLKGEPYEKRLYMSDTYRVWQNMKTRCSNKKVRSYKQYGNRGITVCSEWDSFKTFFDDMGERPEGLTLDRIDNSLGYSKINCKWSTPKEQALNTRNIERADKFSFNGETHTVREWAEIIGVKRKTLGMRLQRYGWSVEKALTQRPTHELAHN